MGITREFNAYVYILTVWEIHIIDFNGKLSLKRLIGYLLLFLSFVLWGLIALIPFLDIAKGEMAGATTILFIIGEVLFWGAIALLGREAWGKLKAIFKR